MSGPPDVQEFFVPGMPVPQGSMVAFHHRTTGKLVMPQPKKLVAWRWVVIKAARAARIRAVPPGTLVRLELVFVLPPAGGRASWLDVDKLARGVLDALSNGVLYADDSQVEELEAKRRREPNLGLHVRAVRL